MSRTDFIEKEARRLSQKHGRPLYPPLVVDMSGYFIQDSPPTPLTVSHVKKKKPSMPGQAAC